MGENEKAATFYKKLLRRYAHPASVANNIQKLIDRLQMDKMDRLEVSSWRAWLDDSGKIAHYLGDVEVSYGKMKIIANKAELNVTENVMMIEGNVRLSWANKVTVTADKAGVNFAEKRIMLTHRVQVLKRQGTKVITEDWASAVFSIETGTYSGQDEQMEMK